ncbi:MAG: hypothetical protein UU22_C0014G0006 [Parcubacteria group bacterium GW2011_GWA2_40_8]|nr:MAG: hypothetical protein UT82_C0009G0031 [Parcubacteria group bacterium GW2011_GWB1_40_14]KKR78747.1 MAG: hypothetical protein UU22_C0014G0006 [Parcubacteria group bacterium GW2011_GWA2_40_8]
MLIGSIILILLVVACYFLLIRFAKGVFGESSEILAASVPVAFLLFSAITSVFLIVLPTLWAGLIGSFIIIVAGFFSFYTLNKNKQNLWVREDSDRHYGLLRFCITVLIFLTLFLLISQSLVQKPDGSLLIGRGAAVDTPYHLSQVTRIGLTEKWDFEEPNFSGEFIKYPYFINLLSGFILKLGSPLVFAFHAPIMLLVVSSIFLLVSFFRFLGLSKNIIIFAVLVTLFGGGLGYISYLQGVIDSLPLRHSAPYPMQNIAYPAMVPLFFMVQRTFVLGFVLFILSMRSFLEGLKNNNLIAFVWSGIIIGLLPLAHTHSFIAASLVVGAMLTYLLVRQDKLFFNAARGFIFFAVPLAIPSMGALLLLPKYLLGNIFSLRLGWMTTTLPNNAGLNLPSADAVKFLPWLRYMWTNFGPLILMPFAILTVFKKLPLKKELVFLSLGALSLWAAPNIFQFQIWDFDTNKFFAYAILFSVAALGVAIESLNKNKKLATGALIAAIIVSLPSGLISSFNILERGGEGGFVMFDKDQSNMVAWIRSNTDEDDVFLSSAAILDPNSIQNPVVIAAGRKATMGFSTWLFTHGIDFSERSEIIKLFFNNPENAKAELEQIPADYLLVDDILRKYYPDLENRLEIGGWKSVLKNDSFNLIKLK